MYTHNIFNTSACVRNVKGTCVIAPISQATYIKKLTPPYMAGVNQILNVVWNGRNPTVVGQRPSKPPPPPQRDTNMIVNNP